MEGYGAGWGASVGDFLKASGERLELSCKEESRVSRAKRAKERSDSQRTSNPI
jgi:hypothetical protein